MCDFWMKIEKVDGDDVNMQIWDYAGAQKFRSTNNKIFKCFNNIIFILSDFA